VEEDNPSKKLKLFRNVALVKSKTLLSSFDGQNIWENKDYGEEDDSGKAEPLEINDVKDNSQNMYWDDYDYPKLHCESNTDSSNSVNWNKNLTQTSYFLEEEIPTMLFKDEYESKE